MAAAKAKADREGFHSHAREKAIQDELLRLQKKLDDEAMLTSAATYQRDQAIKNASATSSWADKVDGERQEIKKSSAVKLW